MPSGTGSTENDHGAWLAAFQAWLLADEPADSPARAKFAPPPQTKEDLRDAAEELLRRCLDPDLFRFPGAAPRLMFDHAVTELQRALLSAPPSPAPVLTPEQGRQAWDALYGPNGKLASPAPVQPDPEDLRALVAGWRSEVGAESSAWYDAIRRCADQLAVILATPAPVQRSEGEREALERRRETIGQIASKAEDVLEAATILAEATRAALTRALAEVNASAPTPPTTNSEDVKS
jgi:hypothetical protein